MNGSLGRDRVWNDHTWSEIDKAVREEVGRVRVAQKVFPSTVVDNVLPVSVNRMVPFARAAARAPVPPVRRRPAPPAPGIDEFRPFFEISREFVLTQAQVDGEENARLAPSFARLAASAIANAEDTILFLGEDSIRPLITSAGVNVTNPLAVPYGFVAEANNFPAVNVPPPVAPALVGDILTAVAGGMAALNADAQPGPYALFLSPNRYAQTFAPMRPGASRTHGDQIKEVVTGGFYMANSLAHVGLAFPALPNPDIGILVSLGGEPTKIILGTEAMTAFTHTDAQSNHHFRVFERIQMVVRDGRAFQMLTY